MAANQSTTRIYNRREILAMLMARGDMSRAGLAKELGLSKPATAENVEGLIAAGLVLEVGEGEANKRGGRKPRMLRFNKNLKVIAAVDVGRSSPVLALGNLKGEMLLKEKPQLSGHNLRAEDRIALIERAIDKLLLHAGFGREKLGMILLSSPGIIMEDNVFLYANPQFRNWTSIGLVNALSSRFHVPVTVKNDMSTAALGEYTLGIGKNCTNMVYVSCGMGLGSGLMLGGSLHEGKNFAAGEISYFVDRDSYQNGTSLEDRVAFNGLVKSIQDDIRSGKASGLMADLFRDRDPVGMGDLIWASRQNDAYFGGKLEGIAQELGFALANITSMLDVDKIVLGGEYLEFFDALKPEIEGILTKCTPVPPQLVASELGEEAGLYGAFIFARDELYSHLEL